MTISAVRMLAIGVYAPYRDGFDLRPTRCRKWVQSNYAVDYRREKLLPTVVGECDDLPEGTWAWLEERIERSGMLQVKGRPRVAATDLPTWHIEVSIASEVRRFKSYGAGVTALLDQEPEVDSGLRAMNLAIGWIEQFVGRVPWIEHLERQPVKPGRDQMADLLS